MTHAKAHKSDLFCLSISINFPDNLLAISMTYSLDVGSLLNSSGETYSAVPTNDRDLLLSAACPIEMSLVEGQKASVGSFLFYLHQLHLVVISLLIRNP